MYLSSNTSRQSVVQMQIGISPILERFWLMISESIQRRQDVPLVRPLRAIGVACALIPVRDSPIQRPPPHQILSSSGLTFKQALSDEADNLYTGPARYPFFVGRTDARLLGVRHSLFNILPRQPHVTRPLLCQGLVLFARVLSRFFGRLIIFRRRCML